jgi:hypothetical protein
VGDDHRSGRRSKARERTLLRAEVLIGLAALEVGCGASTTDPTSPSASAALAAPPSAATHLRHPIHADPMVRPGPCSETASGLEATGTLIEKDGERWILVDLKPKSPTAPALNPNAILTLEAKSSEPDPKKREVRVMKGATNGVAMLIPYAGEGDFTPGFGMQCHDTVGAVFLMIEAGAASPGDPVKVEIVASRSRGLPDQ